MTDLPIRALLVSLGPLLACAPAQPCRDGTEGCPCRSSQSCDPGLSCASGLCAPACGGCGEGERCSVAGVCIESWSCVEDADCHQGSYCCAAKACAAAGTCCADSDCGAEEYCGVAGVCVASDRCLLSADCTGGDHCCATGRCVPAGTCCADADCATGTHCSLAGVCLPEGTCEVDADCSLMSYCCSTGWCVPTYACCTDADCPALEYCWGEYCFDARPDVCVTQCLPGHSCRWDSLSRVCVETPHDDCTADLVSGAARLGCASPHPSEPSCCPAGERCCWSSHRCSAPSPVDGVTRACIPQGSCIEDSDCLAPYFQCDAQHHACVPLAPCVRTSDCPQGGQICSLAGGCIPQERCAIDYDCPGGELCSPAFACVRAPVSCEVEVIPPRPSPNALVLMDRSSSMQLSAGTHDPAIGAGGCCGAPDDDASCELTGIPSRWQRAVAAVDDIDCMFCNMADLGLATYPEQWCGAGPCGLAGNACSCDPWLCTDASGACVPAYSDSLCAAEPGQATCEQQPCAWDAAAAACGGQAAVCQANDHPGQVDVSVGAHKHAEITAALASTYPGGLAPLGPTLRRIAADPVAAGLASTWGPNYIFLLTGGVSDADPELVDGCAGDDAACKVDAALDALRALPVPIRTVVVGFAGPEPSPALSCHALHGGSALTGGDAPCPDIVDASDCAAAGCIWDGAACIDCTAAASREQCAMGRCTWDAAASRCAGRCPAIGDGQDCIAAGCSWNVAEARCLGCADLTVPAECDMARCVWDAAASECVGPTLETCHQARSPLYWQPDDLWSVPAVCPLLSCEIPLPDVIDYYAWVDVYFMDESWNEQRVPPDHAHLEGWDLFSDYESKLFFYGEACERLLHGEFAVVLSYCIHRDS